MYYRKSLRTNKNSTCTNNIIGVGDALYTVNNNDEILIIVLSITDKSDSDSEGQ